MIETGAVLDERGEAFYWHIPQNRSVGVLPDSYNLWNVFWQNRNTISGFAHSHPGFGKTGPSPTDITTFAAIEAGLGKRLDWWITSGDSIILIRWNGPNKFDYQQMDITMEPNWVHVLRQFSAYTNH